MPHEVANGYITHRKLLNRIGVDDNLQDRIRTKVMGGKTAEDIPPFTMAILEVVTVLAGMNTVSEPLLDRAYRQIYELIALKGDILELV